MKNLVLGGVSSYTIVDGTKVTERDLGNNFLMDKSSLGQSKAECCSRLLQDFNESVSGRFVAETPEQLMDAKPDFFDGFDLVLATQLTSAYQHKLCDICRKSGARVVFGRSYGLFGLVRISASEHTVVESKPDNVLLQLRVKDPWPELAEYASNFDLESLDDMTYKHVPYVVLLIKFAEAWKLGHGGNLPQGRAEQRDFKAFVRSQQRRRRGEPEGVADEGENFREAVENAHYLWSPPGVPSEISRYFADPACEEITSASSHFWVCMAAVKDFVAERSGGALPLPGSIPDMTATTDLYLDLKRLYDSKAEEDCDWVFDRAIQILSRTPGADPSALGRDYVKGFCKNCAHVKVLRFPTVRQEQEGFLGGASQSSYLQSLLLSEDTAENAFVYLMLHAADRFRQTHGHFPGKFDDGVQEDVGGVKSIVSSALSEAGLPTIPVAEEYVQELCRCGAGEIHTVAAVVGGIVAEEAIKLLTEQFVPLSGTLVYNAIRSTTLRIGKF